MTKGFGLSGILNKVHIMKNTTVIFVAPSSVVDPKLIVFFPAPDPTLTGFESSSGLFMKNTVEIQIISTSQKSRIV